jgi:hypothetical protein
MGNGSISFNINERIFLALVGAVLLAGYYFLMRAGWKIGEFGGVGWSIGKAKQSRLFRAYFYFGIAAGIAGAIALVGLIFT